jgi:tetratricopeptide (TPR) repeat protein
VADQQRIDDLRRRVQRDPASIAFAQLAEELRRAGQLQESVEVCQAGLAIHPGYLSARVTLGRALVEMHQLGDAQSELEVVLRGAPENLAAIRGLADIHHRRGSMASALAYYRTALALAHNDPDLQRTVAALEAVEPAPDAPAGVEEPRPRGFDSPLQLVEEPVAQSPGAAIDEPIADLDPDPAPAFDAGAPDDSAECRRAMLTVAALEHWLDAVHVARTQPRA